MMLEWFNIIGLAGPVIGLFALVLSFFGYRKANTVKSLDLRIELKKSLQCAHESSGHLKNLIQRADRSRHTTASLRGVLQSSMMENWKKVVAHDKEQVEKLTNKLPAMHEFNRLNHAQLETELIKVHELQLKINRVTEKYERALHDDKATNERLAIRSV